jgi:hypothetical protein
VGFLLKAGFWFSIVLLFLPENPNTLHMRQQMSQGTAQDIINAAETSMRFCKDQPEICKSAAETSKAASGYIALATEQMARQNQTKLESDSDSAG